MGEIAFFIEKKLSLLFFGLKEKLTITKIVEKLSNETKEERKNKLNLLKLGKKDFNMIKSKIYLLKELRLKDSHPDEEEFENFLKNRDEINERAERQKMIHAIGPLFKLLEVIDSVMKK